MTPIEIRPNRFTYLIPIPFVLLLMWFFYRFVLKEPQQENMDKTFFYLAIAIMIVGSFLVLNFSWRFIKSPVVFRLDETGIQYNPAGVTTGLIKWEDINDAREINIQTMSGNVPGYETVLALSLKDPEAFRKRYNILFRKALALSEARNQASILIEPSALGKNYAKVKAEIKQRVPLSFLE